MRIPDFAVFTQMPITTRRQWLELISRFPSQHGVPLLLQVYQFDPDNDLCEIARLELAKHGITPSTDSTPVYITTNGRDSATILYESGASGYRREEAIRDVSSTAPHTPYAEMFGHPLQRGPHLANIFTLDRYNAKFLTDEHAHLRRRSFSNLLMIGILICVSAILWSTFKVKLLEAFAFVPTSALVPVDIAAGVIALGTISLWIWRIRRDQRYEIQGKLLLGEVTGASSHLASDSEGWDYLVVHLDYRVSLPDGVTVTQRAKYKCANLFSVGIPISGDPVAVLVIDRNDVRLL